ncbi:hypothetical protein ACWCV5_33650 [Streptomyces tubercidicus]
MEMRQPRRRSQYVRQSLVRWLYEIDTGDARWNRAREDWLMEGGKTLGGILRWRRELFGTLVFHGEEITEGDLEYAYAFLHEKGLAEHTPGRPGDGIPNPRLTALGIDCAESDKTIEEYTSPATTGTVYNNYLSNVKGAVIGEQSNFTQNNSEGVDTAKFIQLAALIGEISGALPLEGNVRVDMQRDAQELNEEATSSNPEPGRLRALTSRIAGYLDQSTRTALSEVAVKMTQEALASLS